MRRIPVCIALFSKPESADSAQLVARLADWFAARGVETRVLDSHAEHSVILSRVPGCDLALVAGGDGSIISVGRRLVGLNVPILGINMGTLGFLTEIPATQWEEHCELLLEEGFVVRERLALSLQLFKDGRKTLLPDGILSGAVNDVIFSRTTLARVIALNVEIDGQPFARLRGDGLLVSTPVGTTGYAMSAGGVMLHPDIEGIELTPVCPVLHSFRPLVAPRGTVIRVSQAEPVAEVGVTIDGQECFCLERGDVLEVRAADSGTLFAQLGGDPYWRQLSAKGFIPPPPVSGGAA